MKEEIKTPCAAWRRCAGYVQVAYEKGDVSGYDGVTAIGGPLIATCLPMHNTIGFCNTFPQFPHLNNYVICYLIFVI